MFARKQAGVNGNGLGNAEADCQEVSYAILIRREELRADVQGFKDRRGRVGVGDSERKTHFDTVARRGFQGGCDKLVRSVRQHAAVHRTAEGE